MDSSMQNSSVHGISQARISEWVAIPFSRGSSPPRNWAWVSHTVGGFLPSEPEAQILPALWVKHLWILWVLCNCEMHANKLLFLVNLSFACPIYRAPARKPKRIEHEKKCSSPKSVQRRDPEFWDHEWSMDNRSLRASWSQEECGIDALLMLVLPSTLWCNSDDSTAFIPSSVQSVQFSPAVVSDSLRPHGLWNARLPCPLPTPRVYSNSCTLSWWCHLTISSSIAPSSSCLQSFPASGSFQVNWFFASAGQSIGVSASGSVLPMNIQDWFPLGWTGWISLQSKGLSRVFSNTTVQKHQFFSAQLPL